MSTMTRYLKIILLSLASSLAICFSMPTFAKDAVGVVIFGINSVNVVRNGKTLPLKKGESLYNGDTLSTGPKGRVFARFNDKSRISLRPSTEFKIEKFSLQQDGSSQVIRKKSRSAMSLIRGGFRAVTGLIGKTSPEAVSFKTPVATIGIRGTDLRARICQSDCAIGGKPLPAGLYVGVSDGAVDLFNDQGTLPLATGQFGYVPTPDVAPQPTPQIPLAILDPQAQEQRDVREQQQAENNPPPNSAGDSEFQGSREQTRRPVESDDSSGNSSNFSSGDNSDSDTSDPGTTQPPPGVGNPTDPGDGGTTPPTIPGGLTGAQ